MTAATCGQKSGSFFRNLKNYYFWDADAIIKNVKAVVMPSDKINSVHTGLILYG